MLATVFWGYRLAHFGAAMGCLVAAWFLPRTLNRLMRITKLTMYSGVGVFLLQGFAHFVFAVDENRHRLLRIGYTLDFLLIWVFLVSLYFDTRKHVRRLTEALASIQERFDGVAVVRGKFADDLVKQGDAEVLEVGKVVVDTIQEALHGQGHDGE